MGQKVKPHGVYEMLHWLTIAPRRKLPWAANLSSNPWRSISSYCTKDFCCIGMHFRGILFETYRMTKVLNKGTNERKEQHFGNIRNVKQCEFISLLLLRCKVQHIPQFHDNEKQHELLKYKI